MSINFNSASVYSIFSSQSPLTSFSLDELRKKVPGPQLPLIDQYFEVIMSKSISEQMDVIDMFVYEMLKTSEKELGANSPEPDLKGFVEAFGLVNAFVLFGRCFLLASRVEREQGDKLTTRVKALNKILISLTSDKSNPDYLKLEQAEFDLEKLKFVKEKVSLSFVTECSTHHKEEVKSAATPGSKKSNTKSKLISLIGLGVVLILAKKFLEIPKMDQLKKALSSYPPRAVPIVESCMESEGIDCQEIFATAYNHLLGSESDYLAYQLAGECLKRNNCKHDTFAKQAYLKAVELGSRGMREDTNDRSYLFDASHYAETCLDQLDRPVCKFIVDQAFSDFLVSPYAIKELADRSIKRNNEYLMRKIEKSYPKLLEKHSKIAREVAVTLCAKKQSPICVTSSESSS